MTQVFVAGTQIVFGLGVNVGNGRHVQYVTSAKALQTVCSFATELGQSLHGSKSFSTIARQLIIPPCSTDPELQHRGHLVQLSHLSH